MKTKTITTAAIAVLFMSSAAPHSTYAQARPAPATAAVVVASETQAAVETVDRQARQVLLHLPDNTLLTLTVSPQVKSIDRLEPGDHVAVKYIEAAVLHLDKTNAAATEELGAGTSANGEINGVRTVVGTSPARGTVILADAKGHIETLGVHDASVLDTLQPGDRVAVTYKEAIAISLTPV
jgi:cyanate lyase